MDSKPLARIERGGLTIAILVVFTLTALSLFDGWRRQENNYSQAEYEAGVDARRARHQANYECAGLPPPKEASCRHPIISRAREEQRREYEVEAQQNAALWGEAMGKAALIGMFFTVFGLVLIFETFDQQRAANRRARKEFLLARKHDLRSLKHSQWVSHQELRPYVFVDKITPEQLSDRVFRIVVWLKNFGQTPARNIEAIVTTYVTRDLSKLRPLKSRADNIQLGTAAPNAFRRAMKPLIFTAAQWESPPFDLAMGVVRIKYTYTDDTGENRFEESFDYFTDADALVKEEPMFYLLNEQRVREERRRQAQQGDFLKLLKRTYAHRKRIERQERKGGEKA
jgi:hypothetical protein